MGRGLSTEIEAGAASSLRSQSKKSQLQQLFAEPAHNDDAAIRDTYLEQGLDPSEVFLSLPGSSAEYWKQLDGWKHEESELSVQIRNSPTEEGHENPWLLEDQPRLSVYMDIVHQGQDVGDFGFHIMLKPDNKLSMQIGPAELRFSPRSRKRNSASTEKHMGSGFASALVKEIEKRAVPVGVVESNVHAVNIGGYAWATMGFEFDPRQYNYGDDSPHPLDAEQVVRAQSQQVASSMLYEMERLAEDRPDLLSQVSEFAAVAESGQLSLRELADWGRERSWMETTETGTRENWLGKQGLIRGDDWNGVKFLV